MRVRNGFLVVLMTLIVSLMGGFGVVALIPVVGQFAFVVSTLCAAVRALSAISEYETQQEQYQAFGPLASRFDVPNPDGTGMLVKALEASAEAIPVLSIPGKLAGRLIRVTAVRALVGDAAQDIVSVGVEVLAAATEDEIKRSRVLDIPKTGDSDSWARPSRIVPPRLCRPPASSSSFRCPTPPRLLTWLTSRYTYH